MEPLTHEQWEELFTSCQQSASDLEMRDWYAADDESQVRAFPGHRPPRPRRRSRAWLNLMRKVTSAGVRVRRARIVSEPVSDYIRFEWHGAGPTIEAGEELRWLPRRLASGLALPGNDFWLFDERTAMFNHFSGDGRPLGQEITDDPAAVELCRTAFEAVWKLAIPHHEYAI